jgi:hypothetical protein
MSGSTLRRTVLCLVVVALLLPLASAYAAPARSSESARIQLPELSRILLAPFSGLLDLFRPVTAADAMPPGQKPGNDDPATQSREGNGFDPHGKP